jgi:hypothetical protein
MVDIRPVDNPVFDIVASETSAMPVSPRDAIVHTPADLFALWQSLMGHGGFSRRSLWLVFVYEDGHVAPVVIPIEDIPKRPDVLVANLGSVLAGLADDGVSSTALLLSRPGPRAMTTDDRAWARALAPFTPWPVHLATADELQVFAPDDLIAA